MNKRQLKKASDSGRNWRLPQHLQIKADKWFHPFNVWTHDLKPGDKYLDCSGTVREMVSKEWSNYEWEFMSTDGYVCHSYQCVDQLLPQHLDVEPGTKLSNEELNLYWGEE